MNENFERVIVWFSAGVTSAVAARIAVDKYPAARLVMCDTGSEHDDNYRFAHDVAEWLNKPIEVIRSKKYSDTFEVYDATGFFKNQFGARCTTELKLIPRRDYQRPRDLQVFGFDASESKRAERFSHHFPEISTWFPLVEAGIDKRQARQILLEANIREPITYSLGFKNANCLKRGCVKGGMGYWNHVRVTLPDVFNGMAEKERELGYALCSRESKGPNGERVKTPVYLDELLPNEGSYKSETAFQCGLFCNL
jgi:3'-phosphoadenosine 5'-phosphosulfate sulfotransferase (PAPS reductase)/FAD synthetase